MQARVKRYRNPRTKRWSWHNAVVAATRCDKKKPKDMDRCEENMGHKNRYRPTRTHPSLTDDHTRNLRCELAEARIGNMPNEEHEDRLERGLVPT